MSECQNDQHVLQLFVSEPPCSITNQCTHSLKEFLFVHFSSSHGYHTCKIKLRLFSNVY